jgi:hypothetical protein
MTLEQLKAEAGDKIAGVINTYVIKTFGQQIPETFTITVPTIVTDAINDLINSTHQATVEEIIKIAENLPGEIFIDRDTLIKAIKK